MSLTTYAQRMGNTVLRDAIHARGLIEYGEQIVMRSLLNAPRLLAIMAALDATQYVEGDTAEIGCAGGGTSLMIALLNGGRRHWACDTFSGLEDCGGHDDLSNGDFGSRQVTAEIVSDRLAGQNVRVVEGFFPDSAPTEMQDARYAFAHLDVDTYGSMRAAFAFFAERMTSGGIIAMDDVIGRGTRGAKQAWTEIDADARGRWEVIAQNDPQVVVRFA